MSVPQRIEFTHIAEKSVVVSTVDLSLIDHPMWGMVNALYQGAKPLAEAIGYEAPGLSAPTGRFETMVFPADEDGEISDFHELECFRYDDLETARQGHFETVEDWKSR